MTRTTHTQLEPDDPRLTWQGIVSLHRADGWVTPWRLPYETRALFPPERLQERAQMPAGVRLSFYSDTTTVAGTLADVDPESSRLDLCCDGRFVGSVEIAGQEGFAFTAPPANETRSRRLMELWLPQFGVFRLRSLELSPGASVAPVQDTRPRWITYGSSITQCRGAASPTQTWPAIVARARGYDLTCLGFGGECHLDTMVARTIRDRPADLISLCLGINIYGGASLSPRTFRPAVIGFVQTVREGHPDIPLITMSPIVSPPREETTNVVGFDLPWMRQELATAVRTLQDQGDTHIHYVSGLDILGPDHAHLLPDDLHPNAEGYKLMGQNIMRIFSEILG
jgi:lysophospholipase L1-like esterase